MRRQSGRQEGEVNYSAEIDRAIDDKRQESALALAEAWVAAAQDDAGAWSKLAHVHEMNEDFVKAGGAVAAALKISPQYPPYLFKRGYIEYRLGNYADAASAFELCVLSSELTLDGYYLDAARIARARCLVLDGRADLAVDAIGSVAEGAATWLERRFSKEDVLKSMMAKR